MQVKIKKLHPDAIIPKYATDGSACFDLASVNFASLDGIDGPVAETVRTGLAFEIPDGHVLLIFSRSGHGFKNGVRLSNCIGVIDSDYRGEISVKLHTDSLDEFIIKPGDRIAQAMIVPIPKVELVEVEELTDTERGTGGFGSTGV